MKMIGIVKSYNGKFGIIVTQDNYVVDFNKDDISFNQNIEVGSYVEFRVEIKPGGILIARNISSISNT